jgi:hypothetical protein
MPRDASLPDEHLGLKRGQFDRHPGRAEFRFVKLVVLAGDDVGPSRHDVVGLELPRPKLQSQAGGP